ncbi:MAG TPA: hypothetical protein VLG47_00445 [Candidatus Saccharimonadales bacterium]|nr:hypothetical protein [Candidatus Saccharimonadales bacterium]
MYEVIKGVVTEAIDAALASIRVDSSDDWMVRFPPDCGKQHGLNDILAHHRNERAFVYQAITKKAGQTSLGIITFGRSTVNESDVQNPISELLRPALGEMAFTAVLTTDIETTYPQVVIARPLTGVIMDIPLVNEAGRLWVDSANLSHVAAFQAHNFLNLPQLN